MITGKHCVESLPIFVSLIIFLWLYFKTVSLLGGMQNVFSWRVMPNVFIVGGMMNVFTHSSHLRKQVTFFIYLFHYFTSCLNGRVLYTGLSIILGEEGSRASWPGKIRGPGKLRDR